MNGTRIEKPHATCFLIIAKWMRSERWLWSYERLKIAQIIVFLALDA